VYLTGSASLALLCLSRCTPDILTFRNNLIWAAKIGSANGSFTEGYNLYWGPLGVQGMNFAISSTSRRADPRFVDRAAGNLRLASTSPARDAAGRSALELGYARDLDRRAVPQAGAVDMGAYERSAP